MGFRQFGLLPEKGTDIRNHAALFVNENPKLLAQDFSRQSGRSAAFRAGEWREVPECGSLLLRAFHPARALPWQTQILKWPRGFLWLLQLHP